MPRFTVLKNGDIAHPLPLPVTLPADRKPAEAVIGHARALSMRPWMKSRLRWQRDFNAINGAVKWKFNLLKSDSICSV